MKDDDDVKASFHKKGVRKKEPTKRHMEDRLRHLRSELDKWRTIADKGHSSVNGFARYWVKRIDKQIKSLEEKISYAP